MQVRIKKNYVYKDTWDVQVKYWWSPWITKKYLTAVYGELQATGKAREILNPTIIEVK